jgi:hypothetical protein
MVESWRQRTRVRGRLSKVVAGGPKGIRDGLYRHEHRLDHRGHHSLLGQVGSSLQLRNHPTLAHDIDMVADADEFHAEALIAAG